MRSERSDAIALVTTVIRQRPLCVHCIASTASTDDAGAHAALTSIGRVVQLQRWDSERCRACGEIGSVFALDAPLH